MTVRGLLTLTALALGLQAALIAGAWADTLRIGVIAPLTGGGAPWGMAAAEGTKIRAAEINAAGGLDVGGEKYELEVIAYDDQFKAADAVAAYNRLVNQDGVRYMIIHTSAAAVALKQNAEDDEVLALTGGYTPKAIDADTRQLFRIYSAPLDYLPGIVAWMGENLTEKRIVLINPNDETGWDQSKITADLFAEHGFDVAGNELYDRAQQDFQPLFTKALALNPDVIDLCTTAPATAGLMIRQAQDLGFEGQFVKTGGPGWREIVAGAGPEAAEGLIGILYADPANADYQRISAEYVAAIGQEPNEMLLPIYDAVSVILSAIQKAGDVEDATKAAAAFAEVLPAQSIQGEELTLGGAKNWGADQQIMTVNYVGVIHDGLPEVVGSVR